MSCCRRCCVRSRRRPGYSDGDTRAPGSVGAGGVRMRGGMHLDSSWRAGREHRAGGERCREEGLIGERCGAGAERAAAGYGRDGSESRSGSIGLGLDERRRPARGKRLGQPLVPRGGCGRTVAGGHARLPDLPLRGGAGADRRLWLRRAPRYRGRGLVERPRHGDLEPGAVELDAARGGRARGDRGAGVVLHDRPAPKLRDRRHRTGVARDAGDVHPAVVGAGARDRGRACPLPRNRAPASGPDARRGGVDGADDGGRSVGDRQPDRYRRRARCMGQPGQPGHVRRRGHGHAGPLRSHAG